MGTRFSKYPPVKEELVHYLVDRFFYAFTMWVALNGKDPYNGNFCLRPWIVQELSEIGIQYSRSSLTLYAQAIVHHPRLAHGFVFKKTFYDGCYRYVVNAEKKKTRQMEESIIE